MLEIKIVYDPAAPPQSNITVDWPRDKPALTVSVLEDVLAAVKRQQAAGELQRMLRESPPIQVPGADLQAKLLARGANGVGGAG